LPVSFLEPIWRTPIFGARMFVFTGHWPMTHKLLNTKYEENVSTCADASKGHMYIYKQVALQKPFLCIQELKMCKIITVSTLIFSPHHNIFSYVRCIWESENWKHVLCDWTVHGPTVLKYFEKSVLKNRKQVWMVGMYLDIMAKENCTPTLWLPNPSLMASNFLTSLRNDALNLLRTVRTVEHKTF
jgi:hypothetical protein